MSIVILMLRPGVGAMRVVNVTENTLAAIAGNLENVELDHHIDAADARAIADLMADALARIDLFRRRLAALSEGSPC